jgi:hypothetical protein
MEARKFSEYRRAGPRGLEENSMERSEKATTAGTGQTGSGGANPSRTAMIGQRNGISETTCTGKVVLGHAGQDREGRTARSGQRGQGSGQ